MVYSILYVLNNRKRRKKERTPDNNNDFPKENKGARLLRANSKILHFFKKVLDFISARSC